MQPLFSVIIPHYDIPDLLMRCLESIPVSKEIQVIVVDDNSPNADTYLEKYPVLSRPYLDFIRTTKGGGAGYARNIGLDHANGKWLLFADADDFFVRNAFNIVREYAYSDADVVYFKTESVFSDNPEQPSTRGRQQNSLIDGYLYNGEENKLRVEYWSPWGKMTRRELVASHNIRFDEVKYSNDHYFSANVGLNAKEIKAVSRVVYVVTRRDGSLTSGNPNKPHEIETRAEVNFRVQKLLRQHHIVLKPMPFRTDMLVMLKYDRALYRKYLKKICEIYPSTIDGLKDICMGLKFHLKILVYCYSFILKAL